MGLFVYCLWFHLYESPVWCCIGRLKTVSLVNSDAGATLSVFVISPVFIFSATLHDVGS